MAGVAGKVGYKLVSVAVGIPVGIASRKGIERLWFAARPDDPPRKPKDPDVTWGDALTWAALSAVGVAVAELVTIKGAGEAWRFLTGSEPPAKKASKSAPEPAKVSAA